MIAQSLYLINKIINKCYGDNNLRDRSFFMGRVGRWFLGGGGASENFRA